MTTGLRVFRFTLWSVAYYSNRCSSCLMNYKRHPCKYNLLKKLLIPHLKTFDSMKIITMQTQEYLPIYSMRKPPQAVADYHIKLSQYKQATFQ